MEEFKEKVAVITGAASGIGRGLAERCVQEGMKVVLADIEEPALLQIQKELQASGADILAVQVDVSKEDNIKALAAQTLDAFGAVHLLFNNAGVSGGSTVWESHPADWEWVMGVNLFGVIYGIRVFVPIMLKQQTECHIVNTASILGLISVSGCSIYQVTKHGVVTLSESLHSELAEQGSKIKVSVLCPAWVNTGILESVRNRPAELQVEPGSEEISPEDEASMQETIKAMQAGLSPQQVAECVFEAIWKEQFYILTHPDWNHLIQERMENILQGQNPS